MAEPCLRRQGALGERGLRAKEPLLLLIALHLQERACRAQLLAWLPACMLCRSRLCACACAC